MKPKIKFMGKEYDFDMFEFEAWDDYEASEQTQEDFDEFMELLPKYKYVPNGTYGWNGDDVRFENVDTVLDDERYLVMK